MRWDAGPDCVRAAGLEPVGPIRLRQTVATEVLRAGAPLEEIASLLRHRRHATTVIYAKVDWERLRELARPWPGSRHDCSARGRRRLADYPAGGRLQARRARVGAENFVSFLERAGASTITTDLALKWASDTRGSESWKAARLSMVRGFAVYLRTINPATEVPPTGLLLHRKRYAIPYLYSEEEIGRLLAEAAALNPARRAILHGTVIGLLAVTGMRISEALKLDCDDVDLDAGVLTIRNTKLASPASSRARHPEALARNERRAELGRGRGRELLCLRPRQPAGQEQHRAGLPQAAPPRWARAPARVTETEAARLQAHALLSAP